MAIIKKAKNYFKDFNQKKLNNFFLVLLCICLCILGLTFANDILFTWYFIILPIFGSFLIIGIIVYLILRRWIIKKTKTANDLKIEQVLKQRAKEQKEKSKQ